MLNLTRAHTPVTLSHKCKFALHRENLSYSVSVLASAHETFQVESIEIQTTMGHKQAHSVSGQGRLAHPLSVMTTRFEQDRVSLPCIKAVLEPDVQQCIQLFLCCHSVSPVHLKVVQRALTMLKRSLSAYLVLVAMCLSLLQTVSCHRKLLQTTDFDCTTVHTQCLSCVPKTSVNGTNLTCTSCNGPRYQVYSDTCGEYLADAEIFVYAALQRS